MDVTLTLIDLPQVSIAEEPRLQSEIYVDPNVNAAVCSRLSDCSGYYSSSVKLHGVI